ncbi:MAG: hypothetical protein K0R27_5287 [Xanthobacteraceae bacterium]|nr:hypothetical protein [Xanthobacteraceae bacterium]
MSALRPPDDFVQGRQHEEEQRPAERELAPALIGQLEHAVEHHLQQILAKIEAAQKDHAEQGVHDGGLELKENLILQVERQSAEDENHDSRNQRHDRQFADQPIADRQRHHGRDDEQAGRRVDALIVHIAEPVRIRIGGEEQRQGTKFEDQLEERREAFWFDHEGVLQEVGVTGILMGWRGMQRKRRECLGTGSGLPLTSS